MVFAAKGMIYYVAIARVKICFCAKAHLVFHWCLYRYLKIDCIM